MDGVKPLDTRKGWDRERIEAFNRDRILGLASAGWDMIVIDEAHRVAGSSDTVARHAMARMMAEAAPYLLLLSATPHQGKTDAFQRLMSLLDAEAFPDEASVTRDRVAPLHRPDRKTASHQPRWDRAFQTAYHQAGWRVVGRALSPTGALRRRHRVRPARLQPGDAREENLHWLSDGPDAAVGQQFHPRHRRHLGAQAGVS